MKTFQKQPHALSRGLELQQGEIRGGGKTTPPPAPAIKPAYPLLGIHTSYPISRGIQKDVLSCTFWLGIPQASGHIQMADEFCHKWHLTKWIVVLFRKVHVLFAKLPKMFLLYWTRKYRKFSRHIGRKTYVNDTFF